MPTLRGRAATAAGRRCQRARSVPAQGSERRRSEF